MNFFFYYESKFKCFFFFSVGRWGAEGSRVSEFFSKMGRGWGD